MMSDIIQCPQCEFNTPFQKVFDKHMKWLHAQTRSDETSPESLPGDTNTDIDARQEDNPEPTEISNSRINSARDIQDVTAKHEPGVKNEPVEEIIEEIVEQKLPVEAISEDEQREELYCKPCDFSTPHRQLFDKHKTNKYHIQKVQSENRKQYKPVSRPVSSKNVTTRNYRDPSPSPGNSNLPSRNYNNLNHRDDIQSNFSSLDQRRPGSPLSRSSSSSNNNLRGMTQRLMGSSSGSSPYGLSNNSLGNDLMFNGMRDGRSDSNHGMDPNLLGRMSQQELMAQLTGIGQVDKYSKYGLGNTLRTGMELTSIDRQSDLRRISGLDTYNTSRFSNQLRLSCSYQSCEFTTYRGRTDLLSHIETEHKCPDPRCPEIPDNEMLYQFHVKSCKFIREANQRKEVEERKKKEMEARKRREEELRRKRSMAKKAPRKDIEIMTIDEDGNEVIDEVEVNTSTSELTCDKCNFKTKDRTAYEKHTLIHHKEFACTTCDRANLTKEEHENHKKTCNSKTNARAISKARVGVAKPAKRAADKIKDTNQLPYEKIIDPNDKDKSILVCSKCEFKTPLQKVIEKHTSWYHQDNELFSCDHCKYSAITNSDLDNHKQLFKHDGTFHYDGSTKEKGELSWAPVWDSSCEELINTANALIASENPTSGLPHKKEKTKPKNNYRTARKRLLNRHNQIYPKNDQIIQCSSCSFESKNKQVLENHLKVLHHDSVKPEELPAYEVKSANYEIQSNVGSLFQSKAHNQTLKRLRKSRALWQNIHWSTLYKKPRKMKRLNQPNKPKRCLKCPFKTLSSLILEKHGKVYHGKPKSNLCSVCNFEPSNTILLKKHIQTFKHDGIQEEVDTSNAITRNHCNECDFKTNIDLLLLRHKQSKHPMGQIHWTTHTCFFCNYQSISDINRHLLSKHKDRTLQNIISKDVSTHCETILSFNADGGLVKEKTVAMISSEDDTDAATQQKAEVIKNLEHLRKLIDSGKKQSLTLQYDNSLTLKDLRCYIKVTANITLKQFTPSKQEVMTSVLENVLPPDEEKNYNETETTRGDVQQKECSPDKSSRIEQDTQGNVEDSNSNWIQDVGTHMNEIKITTNELELSKEGNFPDNTKNAFDVSNSEKKDIANKTPDIDMKTLENKSEIQSNEKTSTNTSFNIIDKQENSPIQNTSKTLSKVEKKQRKIERLRKMMEKAEKQLKREQSKTLES